MRVFLWPLVLTTIACTASAQGRRRTVQIMTLTSPAFASGAAIPLTHAQPGRDVSPPLEWSGVPDSVQSFVLLVHDPSAPLGDGLDDLVHWLVWNIPGSARRLPAGIPQGAEAADGMRQISVSGPYYRGPGAPPTGPVHPYLFELYALDAKLDVPAVGASPAATRAAVVAAMAGHIRAKAALVGTFRRAAP
jgi:Raf kinase inhibitor-like YbhB/YbcL family protein